MEGALDKNMKITPKFFSLLTVTLTLILSTGLSAKSMKEIGAVLDITESRVSQIHSKAVYRLRTKLKAIIAEEL